MKIQLTEAEDILWDCEPLLEMLSDTWLDPYLMKNIDIEEYYDDDHSRCAKGVTFQYPKAQFMTFQVRELYCEIHSRGEFWEIGIREEE